MSETPNGYAPSGLIATDPFSVRFHELTHSPAAVRTTSKIDLVNDYKHVETWVIDTFRVEGGAETIFLQRLGGTSGPLREMLPPKVVAVIARQHDAATTQNRKRGAQRALATRIARGDTLGNPAALAQARKARRKTRKGVGR